jgi:hypothetical protein
MGQATEYSYTGRLLLEILTAAPHLTRPPLAEKPRVKSASPREDLDQPLTYTPSSKHSSTERIRWWLDWKVIYKLQVGTIMPGKIIVTESRVGLGPETFLFMKLHHSISKIFGPDTISGAVASWDDSVYELAYFYSPFHQHLRWRGYTTNSTALSQTSLSLDLLI